MAEPIKDISSLYGVLQSCPATQRWHLIDRAELSRRKANVSEAVADLPVLPPTLFENFNKDRNS